MPRLIMETLILSFYFLVRFIFDVNILHRMETEIRLHMHSESLYAELKGNIAKTGRHAASNAKRWFNIHLPIHPSLSKDVDLVFCTKTVTSAQKQMIPHIKSKVVTVIVGGVC